jgi:serine/threonine-protein kinase ATR
MAQTFFPPVKCHWFLADIGRMIAEATRDFYDHCLNPVCRTTSTIRARSLLNIVLSTRSLRLAPEYRGILGELPERLLRARLNVGVDWDIVDISLMDIFKKRENPSTSKSLVNMVVQKLQGNLPILKSRYIRLARFVDVEIMKASDTTLVISLECTSSCRYQRFANSTGNGR